MPENDKSKDIGDRLNLLFGPSVNYQKMIIIIEKIVEYKLIIDKLIECIFGIYRMPTGITLSKREEGVDELKEQIFTEREQNLLSESEEVDELKEQIFTEREQNLLSESEEVDKLKAQIFTEKKQYLLSESEEVQLEKAKIAVSKLDPPIRNYISEVLKKTLAQMDSNTVKILLSVMGSYDPFGISEYCNSQGITITQEEGSINNVDKSMLGNIKSMSLQKEEEQTHDEYLGVAHLISKFELLQGSFIQPGSAITNPKNVNASLSNSRFHGRCK